MLSLLGSEVSNDGEHAAKSGIIKLSNIREIIERVCELHYVKCLLRSDAVFMSATFDLKVGPIFG